MITRLGAPAAAVAKNLALLAMALLVFEGLLHVASAVVPAVDEKTFPPRPRLVGDPVSGYRGDPALPEHDALGFRNPSVPARVEIVAMGDSHVYGSQVRAEAAWPRRLAEATGASLYNMGLPTYGIRDSLDHLERAIAFHPKLVLLTLYFGNDFFDDYRTARARGTLADIATAGELAEIRRLEAETGLVRHLLDERARTEEAGPGPEATPARRFNHWIKSWSRVFGLLRNLYVAIARGGDIDVRMGLLAGDFETARAAITPAHRPFVSVHDGPEWKTLLTPRYRLQALDDGDVRIRVGARTSLALIAEAARRLRAHGIAFAVILMPTKELAARPRVADRSAHGPLDALVGSERRWRAVARADLAARGVPVIDPLAALATSPAPPYPANVDSHPNDLGHRIIARVVARELAEKGFLKSGGRMN